MTIKIRTLADFIEASNEERSLDRDDVPARVLDCEIWHAIISYPGCLGDNHAIGRSRDNVIDSAAYWLDDAEPRGWRKALRRDGIYYTRDGRVITLDRHPVHNLF